MRNVRIRGLRIGFFFVVGFEELFIFWIILIVEEEIVGVYVLRIKFRVLYVVKRVFALVCLKDIRVC